MPEILNKDYKVGNIFFYFKHLLFFYNNFDFFFILLLAAKVEYKALRKTLLILSI